MFPVMPRLDGLIDEHLGENVVLEKARCGSRRGAVDQDFAAHSGLFN